MTPEERDLIAGLFARLREADTAPKDREAEEFIRQQTGQLPAAPYLMTQTILVQEHALQNAQARIAELEQQCEAARQSPPAQQSGSFLGGLLGGGGGPWARRPDAGGQPPRGWSRAPQARGSVPQAGYAPPAYGAPAPYPTTAAMPASAGGGFLRSAVTTAAGVAGGALLFQGIEGLLGHNAGAFGPALGAGYGGGYGGPPAVEENVTNNYYGSGGSGGGGSTQQADSGPDQGGVQDADYQPDDGGGDSGSGDDGGGDWV